MCRKLIGTALIGLSFIYNYSSAQNEQQIRYSGVEVSPGTIENLGTQQITAEHYKIFQLDIEQLREELVGVGHRENSYSGFAANVMLPHPDGSFYEYRTLENNTMHPELQERFPTIKTYDAQGLDNDAFVKWDITDQGLHAMIMIPGESTIYIDPAIQGNTDYYIVYRRKDFQSDKMMDCEFNSDGEALHSNTETGTVKSFGTCDLRTYRLALSATGEYTTFHGGTVALAQAAQATTMNRVNGVYEKDMAITMVIVANNDQIIYTNGGSDPFTNGNAGAMITQNQNNTDAVIGNGNYDIGHVFGTNSGGLAGLGVVCSNSQKGRGVTGSSNPIGDPFDIDYVAHEMGHQFGANHTFNNSCSGNRNDATAVEPGSGSTIMAYAGICAPNVQNNSDDHFSGISLEEIGNEIMSGGHTCEQITALSNNPPVVLSTNGNVTVPANTPFALTAAVNDPDGDPVTYNWEQMDNDISTQSPVATSTGGPNFRSYSSSTDPTRYFPNLPDLISGGPFTWEVIPSVSRTMNFRVTVRDNAPGPGGCNDHSDVTVTTDANSGPFVVQYPSANGIVWTGLTSETVTWDVANTDVAPVACANVDILLSTDGGLTYPTVLATNVPNDGSQVVTVPNISTTTAIIMVICSNGTFFDISNNNFEITMSTFDYSLSASPLTLNICQPDDAQFTVNVGSVGGFNDPVSLTVSGVPAGATSSFSVDPVTPTGTSTLTISNTGAAAAGTYSITITGNSTTGTKTTDVTLVIASGAPSALTQLSPSNGATGVSIPTIFTWTASPETGVTYEIDIATDAAFASIVDQATGLAAPTHTSPSLATTTTYYWRVRAVTGCGTSPWSSTWSFGTNSCSSYASVDVGQPIAEASTTVVSTIDITDVGTITDANVANLDIAHAWVGDLAATLTSPTGTTVQLFDGPGMPASQYGCDGDDLLCSFDDAAALTATDFENMCNGGVPTISGDFQSMDPMSNFNGESITGTWTLTIVDSYPTADDGVLNAWSLQLCVDPPCNEPDVPTATGGTTICEGNSVTLAVSSGNLNEATDWAWYSGSCGGTFISNGTSIVVSPTVSTSYFVRGEGGCSTPGVCEQVDVIVSSVYNETADANICDGDTYTFGAQTLTSAGSYTELFSSVNGCDSTVILTLTVNPTYNESEAATICQGDSYIFGSQTLSSAGSYTEMFSSAAGCDSLVTLALTVNPAYNETDAATICQGDAYTFGTQILTTAGTYTESFNSVNGCDSTVVLSLAVSGTYNETASATICQGGSYSFGTQTLTTAGSYTELFSSISGCDSTVLLTLTVVNSYNETDAVTICLGANYTFGTQTLSSAGTYTEVFNSVDGCDSTVVLTLSVTTAFNETDAASICQGNTYTFGTQSLTTSGAYTELFTSSGGCDSTVVLTLVVNTEFNETDAATICQGDTYSFGTQALTTAGTYTEMFISSGGCDSTVVLTLAVNPSYNINQSATICQGESYSLGSQLLTASGTYTEIFTTMAGCDSTIVLTLTVNSAYNETANATICSGDSYSFGSQTLTSAGTYTEMFSTASGCDSLVVLALNVIPAYNETDFATICNGDSYVFGTLTLTSGGTYSQTFQSTGGCDSTVALTLTVLPSFTTTESATICEGDTYTYPDGSSGTVTEAHVSVMTGSNGCDSTIVTALTVNPSYTINESATMCAGDTYTFPDGTTSTIATTNTSSFTTSNGCDSTIITALSIQAIDNSVTVVDVTITANQTGATYQWIDCDNGNVPINGEVGQSFTPTASIGNYAVIVTIGNCSETSDCTLIDRSSIEDIVENSISIYPNPVTDNLTIDWEGAVTRIEITDTKGKLLYVEEVSAVQSHQMSIETYSKGVYFIHVLTNEGRYVFDVVKQ